MFGGASNFGIYDGTFTEVHGNYNVNHSGQSHEAGLVALSQAISHGAIHDSAERYPAGKCHPGTREEIIKTILEWINDPNPSSDVLWLYGPAGAGKSAIMQTIAELLREWYKEHYAGSFFFASGKPGRDQGSALFCTLAYQIATSVPGMREAVNNAMAADIILPKKSMDTQLKSLIVEPFRLCRHPPTHTPTILIDGLDECQGSDTQRALLKLVANARTVAGVPLRFLIASRPEFWIRDTFDRQPLFDLTKRLELSDSLQASLDIKKYLEGGFAEIYDKNLDVMTGVERPWPPTKVLDRFVDDASGQFVYASTVLKFVGAEFCDPRTQLDIISTPGPLRASAFSDLDQLYTKILSVYPRRTTLLRVLGGLVVEASPIAIEKWLGVEHGELNMVLRAINSLLSCREYKIIDRDEDLGSIYGRRTPRITFCHLSFRQYLTDGNRSGEFAINAQVVNDELFNYAFDLIIGSLTDVQKHRDPPVVYDDRWKVLVWVVPTYASPTQIKERLKDLRVAIRIFTGCDNRMITLPVWKYIFQHMSYAMDAHATIARRYDLSSTMLDDIELEIRTVEDECFRQILSSSSFLTFENVPYFVQGYGGDLGETCSTLGVSKELGKMFLIDNAHLVDVRFRTASDGDIQNNIPETHPVYLTTYRLEDFLHSASRGGVFHAEYRKKFIRLSRQALAFLNTPPNRLLLQGDNMPPIQEPQKLSKFINYFLRQHDISDVKSMEDPEDNHNIQAFIEILCAGDNWRSIMDPEDADLWPEIIIIDWLHRQLNQEPAPSLVDDYREGMVEIMRQIYELTMFEKFRTRFGIPYFSDLQAEETWLSSLAFPPPDYGLQNQHLASENGIPPYNILPEQVAGRYSWTEYIGASSTITTVLEEGVYCPPIDRAKCYTRFLEYHLLTYAAHFHYCLIQDSPNFFYNDEFSPKYFAQWFLHAYPSTKVFVVLWTLRHVCSRMKPTWYTPTGFRSGAMEYLETYGLDPTGELHSWLEGLQEVQQEDSEEGAEDSEEDEEDGG